jgi:gas vesicle structural protein
MERNSAEESVSLCEVLDRVLHKGVAVRGDIVLSVAGVDLVYLGLQLILSSTETARRAGIVVPEPMSVLLRADGATR